MASTIQVDTIKDIGGNTMLSSNGSGTITGLPASAVSSGTIATARLGSGTASSSTFLRGDQTYAAAGGENTPAFLVYKTANQELSDNAFTKVTFDTEDFDTDAAFASDKFTVPSGKAGKYRFDTQLYFIANSNTLDLFYGTFYINGGTPNIVNRTGNSVNMWNNEGGEQCLKVTSTFNLTTINLAALGDTVNLTTEVTGTLPTGNGGTNSTATTFVNATSNVTGALPIANGGTGAATFAAAGLSNTPAMYAKLTSDQAVSNDTLTVAALATEIL